MGAKSSVSTSSGIPEEVRKADVLVQLARTKVAKKNIPGWESAVKDYDEAARLYHIAGDSFLGNYIAALECAADAHKELGNFNSAAINLEKAARSAIYAPFTPEKNFASTAQRLFTISAKYYRVNGQYDKAASMLVLAVASEGKRGEGKEQVTDTMSVLDETCKIFEEEKCSKSVSMEESFNKAITFALRHGRYEDALSFIERQNAMFEMATDIFEDGIYKNHLHSTIIRLRPQGPGRHSLKDTEDLIHAAASRHARFTETEYYTCSLALLEVMKSGTPEDLAAEISKETYKYLNVHCARLVRRLEVRRPHRPLLISTPLPHPRSPLTAPTEEDLLM